MAEEAEDEPMSRERPWISSGTIQGRKNSGYREAETVHW